MSSLFELSIEISEKYDFSETGLSKIGQNDWVRNQWPVVYFIENEDSRDAYIGESANALLRIRTHLSNNEKRSRLNKITIIGSNKFNKSATLDIESNLIQYLWAEGTYVPMNGNQGTVQHNYYQKELYKTIFAKIWEKLLEKKVVSMRLTEVENTELFKYSPYKSLNRDQLKSLETILHVLASNRSNTIFISGSAGTGKTVLATYLVKLLRSDMDDDGAEYSAEELIRISLVKAFRKKYPVAKIGFVIAMTPLRNSITNLFRRVPGLSPSMVLSPSDTFKSAEKYDLLLVDEAHRLRQYKNIGWMGTFKQNNQKLGLDDNGHELDWIMANSKNQIFFYDVAQSVKPADVDQSYFDELLEDAGTVKLQLKSQMRVQGDDSKNYIDFVDKLLKMNGSAGNFVPKDYELLFFDSFLDLYKMLKQKEKEYGLCRLIAGYSWPWKSDPRQKIKPAPNTFDIELEGKRFKWNSPVNDWINSPKARELKEFGSIHTVQGYDLNYTGVVFGREINYNKEKNCIEIDASLYFDEYGKRGTKPDELKNYIINIYKTIFYRGIRGTFVYAYHKELREYLKEHIQSYVPPVPFKVMNFDNVRPYVNALPLVDISVAAGNFSDLQRHEELTWVELPPAVKPKQGSFICQVIGESMNKKIPNRSYCLFHPDGGGTRDKKIVLVQHYTIQEEDFGAGYTVKQYHSKKRLDEHGRQIQEKIVLKPLSNDPQYEDLILENEELESFKVVGIFEKVL